MMNKVIDQYGLELEMSDNLAPPSLPVRCIATNTEDNSTAEAWLTLESTRALLNFAYGHEKTSLTRGSNSSRITTTPT